MNKLAIYGGSKTVKKKFDLGATYGEEELNAVSDIINSGTISGFVANSGPKFYGGLKVKELEKSFQLYFKSKYAVGSNSATSSLHSALVAIGIKKGDEVIIPSVSMSASAASILMAGGKPVFVDINDGKCSDCNCEVKDNANKGCFNINTSLIKKKINKNTKAILVVHLFGKSADMKKILDLSKTYNLKIIEDCAQAPGAKYNGKYVGTMGDIGIFSFNQSKTISAGEGGVAITDNHEFALRMQLIRNHAEAMIDDFDISEKNIIGYNYRLTDLEATVAVEQFKKLDKFNFNKIKLSNHLSKLLDSLVGLKGLGQLDNHDNVIFIYPIIINNKLLKISRETFVEACLAEGVPLANGYTKPLTDLSIFKNYIKSNNDFPNTYNLHNYSLIATKICHHANVSIKDINYIFKALKKVHDYFLNES